MNTKSIKDIVEIIDGYKVELIRFRNGETVEITVSKGEFYASLMYAIINASLYNVRGKDSERISGETIVKFKNFAEQVGY
jgi:competence transcription factor ComK